jgi:hypothetical protein
MFDFTIVGATVAVVGVAFVSLIGWRLVPVRKQAGSGSFESGKYLSEVRIIEGSKVADMQLHDVDKLLDDVDSQIVGLVRHEVRISAPNPRRTLHIGDIKDTH